MTGRTTPRSAAIAGGSAFVFTCRVTGAALTLLLQVMLARWMGKDGLGVYVLAFSWCTLLAALSHLGLASASVRVVGQALGEGRPGLIWGFWRRARQIIGAVGLGAALAGSGLALLNQEALPGGDPMPFLLALALVPVLSLISFQCLVAVAIRWIALAFLPTEVIRPVLIFVVVAVVWSQTGELSAATVMLVQLSVMAATAAVLYGFLRTRLSAEIEAVPPEFATSVWVRTGLPLLLVSLFGNYFPELMVIMIGAHLPSGQVAIFHACYRLALVMIFALTAIDSVSSPLVARMYAAGDTRGLQEVVKRATRLGFGCSVLAVVGFAFLGRTALGLFGSEFVAGYATMMILVSAQVVRSAAGPVMSLLSVTGHQHRCLLVFGSALAASILLAFTLVPSFGIRGAAFSVLLVTLGWSIWLHRLVVLHVGVRPSIFHAFARG